MIVCALNVQDKVKADSSPQVLLLGMGSKVKDLLLRDGYGIDVVQTAQIDVLKGVIGFVDLVEDLPGYLYFDPLTGHIHFPFDNSWVREAEVLNQQPSSFLHSLIKYLIILVFNVLVSLHLFHGSYTIARRTRPARLPIVSSLVPKLMVLSHPIRIRVLLNNFGSPLERLAL